MFGIVRRPLLALALAAATALAPLSPSHAALATTLVDVRAGQHPGFDRVVFEFDGPLPVNRSVRYVDQILDRSGSPTGIAGSAFLRVSMSTVLSVGSDDRGPVPTYGLARETFAMPNLIQAWDTRRFEIDPEDGRVVFGIGLARRTPIKVFTLQGPSRLVIDIDTNFRTVPVKVYFLYAPGPVEGFRSVTRPVIPPAVATGALQRMFAGPTTAETARGFQFVQGGVTGFTGLSIRDGVATVQLVGECPSRDSELFDEVELTLRQFSTVRSVDIRC